VQASARDGHVDALAPLRHPRQRGLQAAGHSLPSLSIVIPTYNGRQHLERCLPSVCRHAPPGTQILVMDDGSTDNTVPWLCRCFPTVEVASLPRNQGFCAAVNRGLEHVHGEIVELLNNDTEVCPGWAEAGLRKFADETVGSVAPLVLRMEQAGRRDGPPIIDSAGVSFHVCGWACNRGYGVHLQASYLRSCDVFGPSASAGFYRRSVLERTGGLRPEFGAYLEDVDLAFRLRLAGYRCVYEPASRVFHQGHGTYGKAHDRVLRLIAQNEELMFWMNMPLPQLLLGLGPHLGFQLVRLVSKALAGRLRPFLGGKWQALTSWRQIRDRRREVRRLTQANVNGAGLGLTYGLGVLRRGLDWLRRRQCG
jgi:O-antigen biosynthesis protein